jgi:hypothetical protein
MSATKNVQQSNPRFNHGPASTGKRVEGDDPLKQALGSSVANDPNFALENHGSLFLLRPLDSAAKEWMQEHLPMDNPETQFWGDAIVIEARYVAPIVDGIIGDGLVLQ